MPTRQFYEKFIADLPKRRLKTFKIFGQEESQAEFAIRLSSYLADNLDLVTSDEGAQAILAIINEEFPATNLLRVVLQVDLLSKVKDEEVANPLLRGLCKDLVLPTNSTPTSYSYAAQYRTYSRYLLFPLENGKRRFETLDLQTFESLISYLDLRSRGKFYLEYLRADLGDGKARFQTLDWKNFNHLILKIGSTEEFCQEYFNTVLDGKRRAEVLTALECATIINSSFQIQKLYSRFPLPEVVYSPFSTLELFAALQQGGCKFSIQQIASAFISSTDLKTVEKNIFLSHLIRSNIITEEELPDIFRKAYQSDLMLTWFVIEFIPNFKLSQENSAKNLIRALTPLINDDEAFLMMLESPRIRHLFNNSELEVLNLVKGRGRNNFRSTNEALSKVTLVNLLEESLANLRIMFGDTFNPEEYNLSDILAYYSLGQNLEGFVALLSEDIKKQLRENYKLPEDAVFFTSKDYFRGQRVARDYQMLCAILGDLKLPTFARACGYLADRKKQISDNVLTNPTLNLESVGFIRSKKDEAPEAVKQRVTKQFQEIIKKPKEHIAKAEVLDFLSNFFDETDWQTLSDLNKDKVYRTFFRNPKDTAFLFSQKGALAEFVAEVSTANDGCVKNFAAKFDCLLARHLMPNPALAALYGFYIKEVFSPLAQMPTETLGDIMHGGDRTGDVALKNEIISQQRLNPIAFIKCFEKYLARDLDERVRVQKHLLLEEKTLKIPAEILRHLESIIDQAEMEVAINSIFGSALDENADKLDQLLAFYAARECLSETNLDESPHLVEYIKEITELRKQFEVSLNNVTVEEIEASLKQHKKSSKEAGTVKESEELAEKEVEARRERFRAKMKERDEKPKRKEEQPTSRASTISVSTLEANTRTGKASSKA